MESLFDQLVSVGLFLLLFFVIFSVAKMVYEIMTPYQINKHLLEHDNFALALSLGGYFVSVTIVFLGALAGPGQDLFVDLMTVGGYSLLGIFLLNLSRYLNDKVILRKFSNAKEIIEDHNAGVGVVQLGSYISSALMVAGSINGEGGGPFTALIFFGLGQVVMLLMAGIYNALVSYDIHEELEKDNVAAGIGFAGTLVAVGVILFSSLAGHFVSWEENLKYFALDAAIAFTTLPLFRLFFDKILISQADLNDEIKNDRNCGAAFLELVITVCFAIVLLFVLKD